MSSVTHDADLAVTGKVSQTGTPSADSDLITKIYADANYGGGGSALTVSEGGTPIDITVAVIDFGNGFDVVEGPEDEVNVSLDLGEYTGTDLLVASGGTGASDAATALANLGGQPLDADLTTIAGLAATTGNFIVSEASAWASRTPAQVRTTLALVIGTDVQAFAADLTSLATNWIQASAAGASSLDFHEDTDNGVNRVRLIGPAATADVTLTLPAATDTLVAKATTDILTNKTIDAANNTVTVDAADVATGLLANARIATGTPTGTKFLRDDQVWTVPPGGGTPLTVSEEGTPIDVTVAVIDFLNGFDVAEGPEDEVNVTLDLGEYTGTDLPVASGGTGASTAATALTNLGATATAGGFIENASHIEYDVNVVAASGSTETLDVSLFGIHDITMDAGCTFTFSNPAPTTEASVFILILRGAFTPVFPAAVDWGDGAAPTYTTPSMYSFLTRDAGTTWLGTQLGKAYA